MTADPFRDLDRLRFPLVAISPAGWTKPAEEVGDLTDASPDDDLTDSYGGTTTGDRR
jgi:hypothetical protein